MKGNFYENERLALFIDGANLYSAAKGLGFDIDYRRLLEEFRSRASWSAPTTTPPWSRIRSIRRSGRWSTGWTTTATPW